MSAPFLLPLSCPTCAADVELVNAHSTGLLSIAIVECDTCRKEWEVTSRLLPHGPSRAAVARADEVKRAAKRRAREMVGS